MKFSFRKKNKTSNPTFSSTVSKPDVTILLFDGKTALDPAYEDKIQIIPVLSEHSEQIDEKSDKKETSAFYQPFKLTEEVRGKYVMFLFGNETNISFSELLQFLTDSKSDLIIFNPTTKQSSQNENFNTLYSFSKGKRVALSLNLYHRIPFKDKLCPYLLFCFAAPILADSVSYFNADFGKETISELFHCDTSIYFSAINFFNETKSRLSPQTYGLTFRYLCDNAIRLYALLSVNNLPALEKFDTDLKKSNMALWVAAENNSPIGFVKSLRKNNFRLSVTKKLILKIFLKQH